MKVLCVDDDPNVLSGIRRNLQRRVPLDLAASPAEALAKIRADGPYAVCVTDMQMPGMNGIELLREVQAVAPDTVRMMLTGYADRDTAIEAINRGQIYRFLSKPCQPATLLEAIEDGLKQYQLVTGERELLSETLGGAVKMMCDLLSMVSPAAFGRASRARRTIQLLTEQLGCELGWELDLAAMLCQVGCATIPESALELIYRGEQASPAEMVMFRRHPEVGARLIASIPRLEPIAELVAGQLTDDGPPPSRETGLLRLALDLDTLREAGLDSRGAIAELRRHAVRYDADALTALDQVVAVERSSHVELLSAFELTTGMTIAEPVYADDGVLLAGRGLEVNPTVVERLRNFAHLGRLSHRFRVLVP